MVAVRGIKCGLYKMRKANLNLMIRMCIKVTSGWPAGLEGQGRGSHTKRQNNTCCIRMCSDHKVNWSHWDNLLKYNYTWFRHHDTNTGLMSSSLSIVKNEEDSDWIIKWRQLIRHQPVCLSGCPFVIFAHVFLLVKRIDSAVAVNDASRILSAKLATGWVIVIFYGIQFGYFPIIKLTRCSGSRSRLENKNFSNTKSVRVVQHSQPVE